MTAVASTTAITEYSATEAALAKLKLRLKDAKYDVTTTAGMTTAKQDRRELVTLRTSLEAKRKEIKAPALAHCKLIDEEAKRITAELLALEVPIDEQIKAEEKRKADEKAERDRLAAEAQKLLDDKIAAISQLPLKVIGKDSTEIQVFLAALEAKEFGGEFTGDTLVRAQAAKQSAVDTIRQALTDTKEAEEKAAQAERERLEREAREAEELKAEAIRLAAERFEREQQEAARKAEFERQQAELAEQKRIQDLENDRIRKEQEERDRQLAKERAEAQAEIDRQNAELRRQQEEMQAKIDAENAKIEAERQAHEAKMKAEQEEMDRKRREEEAEKVRIAAAKAAEEEVARLAAEKAQRLAEAKCETASIAFRKILELCNNSDLNETELRDQIAIIAEGNL